MGRHWWGLMTGVWALVGCGVNAPQGSPAQAAGLRAMGLQATPAWGERVVPDARAQAMRITGPQGSSVQALVPGQGLLDVPAAPASAEQWSGVSDVSLDTYRTKLDASPYARRAVVEFLDGAQQVVGRLEPFGAVAVNQLDVLTSVPAGGCGPLFDTLAARLSQTGVAGFRLSPSAADRSEVTVAGRYALCQGVVLTGQQATAAAQVRLDQALMASGPRLPVLNEQGFVTDRTTVMNLLQAGGAYAYDPTCPEVQRKLDPIAANGFDVISMARLKADLRLTGPSPTGAGVNVAVIGGGMGARDQFDCRPAYAFAKHDTFIGDLLVTLAPGVTVRDEAVCTPSGACRSADVAQALMRVLDTLPSPALVNLSLGGPLPNRVIYELLRLLGAERGIPVITSSGNSPAAPAQYPASYARGVAAPGNPTLNNVISVAALGWRAGAYQLAGFNTRGNANVFAAGVNLCPATVSGWRCLNQRYPQNLGISGTSFAAPVVTALSALLTEQNGHVPANLLSCLNLNLRTDPISQVPYPALLNRPCP